MAGAEVTIQRMVQSIAFREGRRVRAAGVDRPGLPQEMKVGALLRFDFMTNKTKYPSDTIIYSTGLTPDGTVLIGGIWKLWEQEGFPLEMSHLLCRDKGWAVDWLEAMADASLTHNLPALMGHVETFLPIHDLFAIKAGFMRALNSGKTYDVIVAEKRENSRAWLAFTEALLAKTG